MTKEINLKMLNKNIIKEKLKLEQFCTDIALLLSLNSRHPLKKPKLEILHNEAWI